MGHHGPFAAAPRPCYGASMRMLAGCLVFLGGYGLACVPSATRSTDVSRGDASVAQVAPSVPESASGATIESEEVPPEAGAGTSRGLVSPPPALRVPPRLPPTPPGIDAERFTVLASLCAVSSWRGPKGLLVGCRSSPPFDGVEEQPDGEVREASEFAEVCFLDQFYRGAFTAPDKDQAILGLDACGDDRVNDISPGSVVLAERDAQGWRVIAVEEGTNVRGCKLSKRPDRTLLVCDDNVGAFSDGSLQWWFTLDLANPKGSRAQVFAKAYASPPTTCMSGPGLFVERGVTYFEQTGERFTDVDRDGIEDLTITVERAHAPGNDALGRQFDRLCAGGIQVVEPRQLVGRPTRRTLVFKGTATALVPTEETRELLETWRKQAPEFWWNFR